MSALRALFPRRPRRRVAAHSGQGLLGAGFLRAVEPPAMSLNPLDVTTSSDEPQPVNA
jgi:hypothetical protein